jgi:NADPH-dependent 2,4-dienoyl-CoA reductase/sulfur reductase-like enzyme
VDRVATEILIVGGGPAGMSAALAASSNPKLRVTVVDDNPRLGGQIWRAELGKTKYEDAQKLIDALESGCIQMINNAQVFDASSNYALAAETPNGRLELEYERLILATGARERFLPFTGWTLPGVFGAGGLQALVKGGLNIADKCVVVAGTGPLLLAVADYLKSKGAKVLLIAEQTSAAKIRRFARSLWRSPEKMVQAAALRAKLVGIPYQTDCWVTECAKTKSNSLSVSISRHGKARTIECDYLACGFHLVPNTELACLLNCEIENGFVSVDDLQQTSQRNIYCAGEPTGIGGIEASIVEGKIAGHAAAENEEAARRLFHDRDKTRQFAERLTKAFALRSELRSLSGEETLVCRCEDVTYERLREFDNWREAKLQTRCGMGACQGRVCGPATEFLLGWQTGSVRPPIFPVKLENL